MQPLFTRQVRIHQPKDPNLDPSHQPQARRLDERKAVEVRGQTLGLNVGSSARQISLAYGRPTKREAGHLLGKEARHQIRGLLLAR